MNGQVNLQPVGLDYLAGFLTLTKWQRFGASKKSLRKAITSVFMITMHHSRRLVNKKYFCSKGIEPWKLMLLVLNALSDVLLDSQQPGIKIAVRYCNAIEKMTPAELPSGVLVIPPSVLKEANDEGIHPKG